MKADNAFALSIGMGVALGTAFGVTLGNVGMGVAIGVALTPVVRKALLKDNDDGAADDKNT